LHRRTSIVVLASFAFAFFCSASVQAWTRLQCEPQPRPPGEALGDTLGNLLASIDEVRTRPYIVTDRDAPRIAVHGSSQAAVLGVQAESSVVGNIVEVEIQLALDMGLPVPDSWSARPSLEPLPIGVYLLYVDLYANGLFMETYEGSFSVEPAFFCGWTDTVILTSNGVSDSFPASLVYDDLLYVLWNETYDGSVRYLTFDGSTWTDGPTIADCRTTSAVGATVFDDKIFTFYSQGTYPVYHLYSRSFDGIAWSDEERITDGDVYDAYGATAVAYEDLLYLFWKRWEPDGIRHIYYATFDGIFWSTPAYLAGDEYINSPVGAVVFQDAIYVFYRNGVMYRAYDGVAWSEEASATSMPPLGGSEGSSPAVVADDDRLTLILLSDIGHLYRVDFDGATWKEYRMTEDPEDSFLILNLAAATYHDMLHLFWGGLSSRWMATPTTTASRATATTPTSTPIRVRSRSTTGSTTSVRETTATE
jgi:hypothetical protein